MHAITTIFIFLGLITGLFVEEALYVGEKFCVQCHSAEMHAWKGSHHDMSMMLAYENKAKVLNSLS